MSAIDYSKEIQLAKCIDAINTVLLNPDGNYVFYPPEILSIDGGTLKSRNELKDFPLPLIESALYIMENEDLIKVSKTKDGSSYSCNQNGVILYNTSSRYNELMATIEDSEKQNKVNESVLQANRASKISAYVAIVALIITCFVQYKQFKSDDEDTKLKEKILNELSGINKNAQGYILTKDTTIIISKGK